MFKIVTFNLLTLIRICVYEYSGPKTLTSQPMGCSIFI